MIFYITFISYERDRGPGEVVTGIPHLPAFSRSFRSAPPLLSLALARPPGLCACPPGPCARPPGLLAPPALFARPYFVLNPLVLSLAPPLFALALPAFAFALPVFALNPLVLLLDPPLFSLALPPFARPRSLRSPPPPASLPLRALSRSLSLPSFTLLVQAGRKGGRWGVVA